MSEAISAGLVFIAGAVVSHQFVSAPRFYFHILLLATVLHMIWTDVKYHRIYVISIVGAFIFGVFFFLFDYQLALWSTTEPWIQLSFRILSAVSLVFAFMALNAFYFWLRGTTGIASGDILLIGVAGVWMPLFLFPDFLLVACVGAMAMVGYRMLRSRQIPSSSDRIPFGAFLAVSTWLIALLT